MVLEATSILTGRIYAVEASSDEFQTVWTDTTFTATGMVQGIVVTAQTQQAFFRLISSP